MEYRGIRLAESVRLYKKDGSFDKNVKRGLDKLVDMLEENGDQLLNEYIDVHTHLIIKFNNCNHGNVRITPNNYKKGKRCRKCSGNCKEQAKAELIILLELNGHEWVDGEYINARSKICVDFNCEHLPHWTSPNKYKQGRGCPLCNESKGEIKIRKCLIENKITYEPQKEFYGLFGLGGGNLSYDFYLPKLNILIEFQGEQHEKYCVGFHKDIYEFYRQQEHDIRKRNYAQQKNIKLLEIWYYDFDNIEEILKEKLIKTQLGKEE